MYSPRLSYLPAFAALLSLGFTDPNSVCYSFGIDFVDEGSYFINSLSNESFTCVSTFQGCNTGEDLADVLLVDPNGDEYLCSSIPTTPENTPELSTCPILKNQMSTGDWIILVLGNNDDGNPFAWERDLYLDVGPQATTTFTPTVTLSITTTPTITATTTTTQTILSTVGPLTTFTVPSKTARRTKTVIPKPVTTVVTKTFTRNLYSWKKELVTTTKTVTASCTIPTKHKDKAATYSPTLIHPAALVTPTGEPSKPKKHRYVRKADRAVDIEYARARVEAAKAKRNLRVREAHAVAERAPDAPTSTITANPVNATTTATAPAITTTESILASTTSTTTLPPATVYSGVFTSTVTLPTPTKTQLKFTYTTAWTTKTIRATWTRTTTVTPKASVTACKNHGGHWGPWRI
ncbi:hypothetical protein BDV96DRAFT_683222 [Lophiotrema nucula]|uniref:P-loop containing nucleoside triphosphate hydrolase protein n=1 Tax=Lophiotrema nucula TaxID=690887 RepID=A0A6A5ZNN0_9PLEO|nr:hypothetical protein BDV96DRAFT_683222 [Lophiotrema nucula]